MRKKLLPILCTLLAWWLTYIPLCAAGLPEQIIKGNVTDRDNIPIIGASIVEKGTQNGTITDLDGNFTLNLLDSRHEIEVSYIGYIAKTLSATQEGPLHIVLEEDNKTLEEVVVVGYQTMRKTDLVGAVSSVKANELNVTSPTLGQSMVGKVAGVQIAQVSGAPYGNTKIRVRGVASINASSDPLYVIDGYPTSSDPMLSPEDIASIEVLKDAASAAIYGSRAAGGVVMITTKHGQKEKIKVDYNFQASNNRLAKKIKLLNASQFADLVVEGRNNAYQNLLGTAWQDTYIHDTNDVRARRIGSYNSAAMIPEFLYDFGKGAVIHPQYDTDWQDELYRSAFSQRHHLAVTGGGAQVRYQVSAAYQQQEGIIVSTGQNRLNFRSNIDIEVSPKFRIETKVSSIAHWNREVQEGRFHQGPILGALIYAPIFRNRDAEGRLLKGEMTSYASNYGFQQIENPVALATETKIRRNGIRHTYNLTATYEPLTRLLLKANLGMFDYHEKYEFYHPTSLSAGPNPPYSDQAKAAAGAIARTSQQTNYLAEFTASYSTTWHERHHFSGVAGYAVQADHTDVLGVKARGYEDDYIKEVTAHGADPSDIRLDGTYKSNWAMLSYFTRLNYNFADKYYLTGSFRGDGSSLFGPKNRWGYFPSVSVAWTLSNERFSQEHVSAHTTLKLRASWGMSGNNSIGNYQYATIMSSPTGVVYGKGTIASAMFPGGVKDDAIGWETTSQYNFGVDLALLDNRLSISGNYYRSHTRGLLFEQPISAIGGANSMLTNLAHSKIQNMGVDLQIDARLLSHARYNLTMSGNLSLNRNKVLDLGGNTILTNGAERSYMTHITREGQPIGMFYGFKVAGIATPDDVSRMAADDRVYKAHGNTFPDGYTLQGPPRSLSQSVPLRAGDLYFEDRNGDGVVNDNDKTLIGSPHPKFTYGLNVSGNYLDLDFSASFNGSYGNKVLDGQDYYLFNMEGSGNQYAEADLRYRDVSHPGNGHVYKASRGGTQSNSTRLSTFYLQDGSFVRCTNITLGYTLAHVGRWTGDVIKKLRVYAAADNPFTLTRYKGYNPEVDYNNGANLTPGVDYGKYPLMTAYSLGIHLTF